MSRYRVVAIDAGARVVTIEHVGRPHAHGVTAAQLELDSETLATVGMGDELTLYVARDAHELGERR